MAYVQKDNSGSLFKNTKKDKDTQPNLTGSLMVDGVMYWVSAWTKTKDDGEKWISLAVKPKDEQRAERTKPRANAADPNEPDW